MYLKVRELVQQISKITYVKYRHVITNCMHIDHTRYTSTLLNIKSKVSFSNTCNAK